MYELDIVYYNGNENRLEEMFATEHDPETNLQDIVNDFKAGYTDNSNLIVVAIIDYDSRQTYIVGGDE